MLDNNTNEVLEQLSAITKEGHTDLKTSLNFILEDLKEKRGSE